MDKFIQIREEEVPIMNEQQFSIVLELDCGIRMTKTQTGTRTIDKMRDIIKWEEVENVDEAKEALDDFIKEYC